MESKFDKKSFFRIGSSSAASWAWGTSLIMGQQIAQQKGLVAWIIWALCNSLTLALFGFLYKKKFITKEFCEKKSIKVIALIIQLFCLLVQLNFINNQFYILTGNSTLSYCITGAIGIIFTMMVFKKGLPTSIKTDVYQWLLAIISIIAICVIGKMCNVELQTFATTSQSGVLWGVWGGIVLFSGPIGDVQHWQRAEEDKSGKAYYLGAVLFAMYMCLILCMAFFKFNRIMNIILLVAVLAVTTSTIDSIAVALHKIGNKKIGTAVAIFMCLSWGLFAKMGMVEMWSSFGIIRFAFAIMVLMLPYVYKGKIGLVWTFSILGISISALFIYLGQIGINSLFGMISFIIAMIILVSIMIEVIIYKRRLKNGSNKIKT